MSETHIEPADDFDGQHGAPVSSFDGPIVAGGVTYLPGKRFQILGIGDSAKKAETAAITLQLGSKGLYVTATPAALRQIATEMSELADMIDASAQRAATAALHRAAGKPGA